MLCLLTHLFIHSGITEGPCVLGASAGVGDTAESFAVPALAELVFWWGEMTYKNKSDVKSGERCEERQSSLRVTGAAVFSRDVRTGSVEGMEFEWRPEGTQDTVM